MKLNQGWWLGLLFLSCLTMPAAPTAGEPAEILTPPAPATPRINGPSVFGVTPGAPCLYAIPATGERPMTFAADGLPAGLTVDAANGRITGTVATAGEYPIVLRAANARGQAEKRFRIVCGDRIALTPPLGWNSWNCWAGSVDQDKVLRSARALVRSGLSQHGWTYVNIDDTWQGSRAGPAHALQANDKFPDMRRLCDEIHALGLKAGIYSTPWITSYASFPGGSSDDPTGAWDRATMADEAHHRFGAHTFDAADARQWAEWGFDYLKYDWYPNDLPHVEAMARALRASGRDIFYSLSNTAPIAHAAEFARWANCWRTTGDIWDTWQEDGPWQNSVSAIGFNQDPWTVFAGPGHWNDPDMLVVGYVGWGPQLHPTRLSPDEQYAHITLWCLLSAPLLIGCDLERLDAFTLNLLSNDEVLAVDQDALGRQARRVATLGPIDIYRKELEDGSAAVGYFNRGAAAFTFTTKPERYGLGGRQRVRDLWRQQDLPELTTRELTLTVPAHGVLLLKFTAVR